MDTVNVWIDDQIISESAVLDRKIKNKEEIEPTNFIQLYLIEMRTNKDFDSKSVAVNSLNEKKIFLFNIQVPKLRSMVMDFFIAGSETTGGTLSWATLFMILHPNIQRKVQKELDTVLEGKEAVLEDMKKCVA